MKRLTVILCLASAALAVGLCVPAAQADCRTFVRRTTYYPPTYHEPYVEKYVAPVAAIYLPLYSAVYLPGYTPGVAAAPAPAAAAPADPCADVRAKALLLEQRLNALERGQPLPRAPAPMPGADTTTSAPAQGAGDAPAAPEKQAAAGGAFAAFAGKNCASCHADNTARTRGGNFVLIQGGKLAELSPEKTGEVIRRLSLPDGDPAAMPRGQKLTPAEKLAGIKAFVEN